MKPFSTILAKSKSAGELTLVEHTEQVVAAIEIMAVQFGLDADIARIGAILHDIGKTSPVFQNRLRSNFKYDITTKPFRHEIASLFFLSLCDESIHPPLIDMVVAHHKSIIRDASNFGLLDLDEDWDDAFTLHIVDWEEWSPTALSILHLFGIATRELSRDEARKNYNSAVEHCQRKELGWSKWKGLLVAADHYASALAGQTGHYIKRAFQVPDLTFYKRESPLYPLSLVDADDRRRHTLVTAPTGAGKTDFLIRRCKKRLFYTLPFQASINAMYQRIRQDLAADNPELDIRLLHASSRVIVSRNTNALEEKALQDKVGSAVKILTPHQIASLVFATRGYETLLLDIAGCDVILDEIHTYTEVTKAIVLKLVEVLHYFDCGIHIGTATMPAVLYRQIVNIMGEENVYQVSLDKSVLNSFDRHIVHRIGSLEEAYPVLAERLEQAGRILMVCNRVSRAQELFTDLENRYPGIRKLLLHSRFKRGERAILENELKNNFDAADGPCIVVSTQVVEVSLDISFDLMITEAAPLDSLIQRFGRVNRKRTADSIGKLKPVYVLKPPENKTEALPYDLELIHRSWCELPDGEVLHERDLQIKLDRVYEHLETRLLDKTSRFRNGRFCLKELSHEPKSVLLESLEIDSVSCIVQSDMHAYLNAGPDEKIAYEIPCRYWSMASKNLEIIRAGNGPFVIPDKAYSPVLGVLGDFVHPRYYDRSELFL